MDRITTLESFDESAQHGSSTFGESVPASTGLLTSFDEPIAAITSANGDTPLKENGAKEVRKVVGVLLNRRNHTIVLNVDIIIVIYASP